MQDTDRNKTCCFIGHRKIKESEELKNKMLETIEHLIKEKDVYIFLFGSKSKFDDLCHPNKNGHRKASKNGMNRILSFVFERRPHLFHGSLDNEPLPT